MRLDPLTGAAAIVTTRKQDRARTREQAQADDQAQERPEGPEADPEPPRSRHAARRSHAGALVVISLGGGLGALARYGIGYAFPPGRAGFPWATFGVNVAGCLLIGVLMVLVTDVWRGWRLVRPFLGVGVLGGFTTFSTYVVDIQRLVDAGAAAIGLEYLLATVAAALAAVYTGITLTRSAVGYRRRRRR